MIVAMAHNPSSYWTSIDSEIEANLRTSIPIRDPVSVFQPMHHLTFAAPRTTAASLCVAACELVGGAHSDALAAASAIHLMHAAAFTHQHLPLTDRVSTRPAIHHAFEPNIELLTGDGIIPFGVELLARSVQPGKNNTDRVLRVIIEITRSVGSQGMVEGLYEELQCGSSGNEAGRVEYACEKKEGELHACGAACGAILGGGSEEEIEKLRKFGLYVGMVQGMLYGPGKNLEGKTELVEKLKGLAVRELGYFNSKKAEAISSLVEGQLCSV
jgi:geranylgeranyl diphosphate synthase type II